FYTLVLDKRLEYIDNAVQKDIKFRNALKGIVIGQFTVEEYQIYIQNSSALNKRMMSMAVTRLKDQLQFFEEPTLV
ncbi:MAG: glyoxalase, partial [Cellulophaga sp.]